MSTLYDPQGNRKYLTKAERQAFLKVAREEERERRTFCEMLHYSGARLSEVLALTVGRIDLDDKTVTIESLKKRRAGVFRTVPLPSAFVEDLTWSTASRSSNISPITGYGVSAGLPPGGS